MNSQKVPQLTSEEQDHILKHRKTKTVPELAQDLKRGQATIYGYLKAKGWTPFRRQQEPRHVSHPFRKMNQRLEAVIIKRRIENRTYNPKKG